MEKNKKKQQSFLWVLMIWCASIALRIAGDRYRIYLAPTNILGTTSWYALIWLPGLFVLGKYIVNGFVEKKRPWLLVPLIVVFGAGLFEALAIFSAAGAPGCYSVSREGLAVSYQCVCRETYIESGYEYNYEDCQFSGLVFSPFVQKLPVMPRREGVIEPEIRNQADFMKQDWRGEPFDIEYPSRLTIVKSKNVQIGYVNFQYRKSTSTFDISFIADLECSTYYAAPVSIKTAENTSVKLCGKEYKLKFIRDNEDFTVKLQE
jgi:hypothetical protein